MTTQLDITNLSGSDLFEALKSGKKFVVTKTPKEFSDKPLKEVHYIPFIDQWTEEAIILIEHLTVCINCGSAYSTPNSRLLVRESHERLGVHYRAISPLDYNICKDRLPLKKEVHKSTSDFCCSCLSLEE